MRNGLQKLRALGWVGTLGLALLGGSVTAAHAHEEGTTPPQPEGASAPAVGGTATGAPAAKGKAPASPKAASSAATDREKGKASGPVRLTLDQNDRLAQTPAPAGAQAGPRPATAPTVTAAPAAPATPVRTDGTAAAAAAKPPRGLKLAPSAAEIEGERKRALQPPNEPRADRYEDQRPDVPAPTQVRRVPGPGSSVGSTANERKATMIENSGPQNNSTYRRW